MEQQVETLRKRRMVRQLYTIHQTQKEMLDAISKATGVSKSDLVRQGIQIVIGGYKDVLSKTN